MAADDSQRLLMEQPIDCDDPATEDQWCMTARESVVAYLAIEGFAHGEVGEWPAWHVAPVASVRAIESLVEPGRVGWWVLYCDMPIDYVAGAGLVHPRDAMRAIAVRWKAYVVDAKAGTPLDEISFDGRVLPDDIIPLLQARAEMLHTWADDDEVWDGD